MCPHGYHPSGFMATPALGTQDVRYICIYLHNCFIRIYLTCQNKLHLSKLETYTVQS